ncbi:MAG: hypothetical protein PSX81_02780 [bacterium]|nr:hypothetical protein [bacterium]
MILKQIKPDTFDLRSIKMNELEHVIQGLQLLQDNNTNILNKPITEQQKIYIDAMMANSNITEDKKIVKETILSQWDEIAATMQKNSFTIQKTLTEIRTIK